MGSRTTQIRRASKSAIKRHGQTRSSSQRTSERLKCRRKTVPGASVSCTIAPKAGGLPRSLPSPRQTAKVKELTEEEPSGHVNTEVEAHVLSRIRK